MGFCQTIGELFCVVIGCMEGGACATVGQTISDSCDVGQQWYDRASAQRCFTASD